jgi:tRNA pseudouridine13 synthase
MSKTTRTALHQAIRELFGGKLDTETDSSSVPGEGSRIAIKWAKHGGGRGGRGGTGGSDCGMECFLAYSE